MGNMGEDKPIFQVVGEIFPSPLTRGNPADLKIL